MAVGTFAEIIFGDHEQNTESICAGGCGSFYIIEQGNVTEIAACGLQNNLVQRADPKQDIVPFPMAVTIPLLR